MFVSSLNHMSGGDAWHCLLQLPDLEEQPLKNFRLNFLVHFVTNKKFPKTTQNNKELLRGRWSQKFFELN